MLSLFNDSVLIKRYAPIAGVLERPVMENHPTANAHQRRL